MKKSLSTLLVMVGLTVAMPSAQAADPAESGIRADVKPIITHIQEKLKAGKTAEADMAEDLKALDGVIARHRNDDKNDLAGVYLLKASIYTQVLDNDAKAAESLNLVKKDFAGTEAANGADAMLAQIKAQAVSKSIQRALVVGLKFPEFTEKDLAGKPLSIAGYKGKVVLIDFWATWCGPCRAELPNVIEIYNKHHAQGFEIIGVSLDSDRAKLESFRKSKGMTWAQYFDGEGWSNKLAKKYGVDSIPMTYLLDREGKIIGKELRGDELAEAVTKALAQK